MSNSPVFSADERVDPPSGSLPAELQGKSAEEVAAFYQRREKERARQEAVPPPTRMPSNTEFWQDPRKAAEDIARSVMATGGGDQKAVTKQMFAELAEPIKQNLIEMAAHLTALEFPDWATFKSDIESAMNQVEPWARTQKHMWKTTYFYVKGVAASKPTVVPPGGTPVQPSSVIIPGGGPEAGRPVSGAPSEEVVTLSSGEAFVAEHMGITPQAYRKAQKDIAEGNFPLTYDNRRGGRR